MRPRPSPRLLLFPLPSPCLHSLALLFLPSLPSVARILTSSLRSHTVCHFLPTIAWCNPRCIEPINGVEQGLVGGWGPADPAGRAGSRAPREGRRSPARPCKPVLSFPPLKPLTNYCFTKAQTGASSSRSASPRGGKAAALEQMSAGCHPLCHSHRAGCSLSWVSPAGCCLLDMRASHKAPQLTCRVEKSTGAGDEFRARAAADQTPQPCCALKVNQRPLSKPPSYLSFFLGLSCSFIQGGTGQGKGQG